jgi:hypothetical protein
MSTPKDWTAYFTHTLNFSRIQPMVDMIAALLGHPLYYVTFVTGRPESNRKLTDEWLRATFGMYHKYHLIMRQPSEAHLRTGEIKLNHCIRIKPELVFEDDPWAVQLLDRNGFNVVQVYGYRLDAETDPIAEG